jgi:hypothetical protein
MEPGTLIVDNEFVYRDGSKGKKILIVLNDGTVGHYIIIKTTSKDTYKGISFGCQFKDRYPNFFLPKGCCCLKKNTWVMIDQFFEMTSHELLDKHFSGKMNRIGVLPLSILKNLLDCASDCLDISFAQARVLKDTLREINSRK